MSSRTTEPLPGAEAGRGGPTLQELRRAVAQRQLVLHYQPVVDLTSSSVDGVEALVRWQHPQRGLLLPGAFLPLAEESGLIVELGEWVLRRAGEQAAAWSTAGRPLDVAVNLSPVQVSEPDFARRCLALLAEAGAPLGRIVLDVTEAALADRPFAADALAQLHDRGVRLALDDFGTGRSSLAYLRRFPLDLLKVDQSFVAGLGRHPDDHAIVASIAQLARSTGKAVIAEGVETDEQVAVLERLGVRYAQGFLWTPPLPLASLEPWLAGFAQRPAGLLAPGRSVRRARADTGSAGPEADRVRELHAEGASFASIAAALNREGLRTASGLRWHTRSVGVVVAEQPGRTGT